MKRRDHVYYEKMAEGKGRERREVTYSSFGCEPVRVEEASLVLQQSVQCNLISFPT